jgi:Mce-associated membrane protein
MTEDDVDTGDTEDKVSGGADVADDSDDAAPSRTAADQAEGADSPPQSEKPQGKDGSAGHPWFHFVALGAAAAVLVAALVFSGSLGWTLWREHQVDSAGQQAEHTAVTYAQTLTSIDSNNIDQNFDQVLNGSTGDFKNKYSQSSMQLRQLLIDNKATAQSQVVESAIQSQSRDKVVVLLMVNQTVTNTARPDSRVDRMRMKITMEKVDGRWLASNVELP